MRPSKETYFLRVAVLASTMSTCVRRSVGCVVVDARNQILGVGFNGTPHDLPKCSEGNPCPGSTAASGTNLSQCWAVHAETNAIIQCRDPFAVDTVYTTTSPCIECLKMLLNTSARKIVFVESYPHSDSQRLWENAGRLWVHRPLGARGCWIDCDEQ